MGVKRLDMIHGGNKLFIVDQIFQCPCSLIRWFMKRVLINISRMVACIMATIKQLNLDFLCVLPPSFLPFFSFNDGTIDLLHHNVFYSAKRLSIYGGWVGATPTLRLICL